MNKLTLITLIILALCGFSNSGHAGPAPGGPPQISIQAHHSTLLKFQTPITRASVADPKVADVKVLSPTQILVVARAKSGGSTTLILWLDDHRVKIIDVTIYTAIPAWVITSMKERIARLAPQVNIEISPGSTKPGERRIILSGTVPSMGALDQVLNIAKSYQIKYYNLIRVSGPQQVQLKVVIAEVSKSGLKQMGLSFFRISDRLSGSLSKGGDITVGNKTTGSLNQGATTDSVMLSAELSSPFGSAFNLAVASATNNLGGILSLLKNQGIARTLASPTLVTMNGQKAEFQVGGSYPVPVQGDNGSVTIEDKDYGILLKFTPYIVGEDSITLEVMPEVSTPDYSLAVTSGGATVPGLTTRKASTTLQLKTGQTFAMAGLLKEDFYQTVDKVPFLGDIPYIGTAFTSKEIKHSESELVIMVTPQIVRPMDPGQVPDLPGSQMDTRPSDTDFFIKNQLVDLPGLSPAAPLTFKGKTGFVK